MKTHLSLVFLLFFSGCSSTYYSVLEGVGIHKRDLVVKRVNAAKKTETEASAQFKNALERFRSVVNTPGGKLQDEYNILKAELDRSEEKAKEVRDKIAAIESVSEALFDEWKHELSQYENARLKQSSEAQLEKTKEKYHSMINAMKRAEKKIKPVLQPLRDNVLFLKHNLNAQAVGSLDAELVAMSENVDVLIDDLNKAVREADRFIEGLERQ